jgi:hypothetical protein
MPTRKFRRNIDHRIASIGREMAGLASAHPQLQDALTSVALNACMLSLNSQALVASCKAASDLFAQTLSDHGQAPHKSREMFGALAHNVLQSSNGPFVETLETLVAIAAEALPPDQRLRTLSNLAVSSGLDDSQIALDYQEQENEKRESEPEPEYEAPELEYNGISLDAFTEIAAVRGLFRIRSESEGTARFLAGSDGRNWYRLVQLRCSAQEAERVAEGVRNRIGRRIGA